MSQRKPFAVVSSGSGRWLVVDPDGDAELGNWEIANCFWEVNAIKVANALNAQTAPEPQQPNIGAPPAYKSGVFREPTPAAEPDVQVGQSGTPQSFGPSALHDGIVAEIEKRAPLYGAEPCLDIMALVARIKLVTPLTEQAYAKGHADGLRARTQPAGVDERAVMGWLMANCHHTGDVDFEWGREKARDFIAALPQMGKVPSREELRLACKDDPISEQNLDAILALFGEK